MSGSGDPARSAREAVYDTIASHLPLALFVATADGRCEHANLRWLELAGLAAGYEWTAAVHPEDAARVTDAWVEALALESPLAIDCRLERPDRTIAWVEAHVSPLHDETARLIGWVGSANDATARRRAERRLRRLAHYDVLTGILNRRGFLSGMERELRRQRRHGGRGMLLLLDLDNFKRVNDSAGHAAGDEVLRGTADTLRRRLRMTDLVGRIGGDEFAALALELSPEEGDTLAFELSQTLRTRVVTDHGTAIDVQASVGIASVAADDGKTVEVLLAEADRAMYEAKERRRHGDSIRT
jgi:diguanylate cyclase (GGDEF)-like protein/PAS domain S-box-containing protein